MTFLGSSRWIACWTHSFAKTSWWDSFLSRYFFAGEAVRFTVNTTRLPNKFAWTPYSMTEKRYAGLDWTLITSAVTFPRMHKPGAYFSQRSHKLETHLSFLAVARLRRAVGESTRPGKDFNLDRRARTRRRIARCSCKSQEETSRACSPRHRYL